jgi:XTP/dITP diphosphohydrolase
MASDKKNVIQELVVATRNCDKRDELVALLSNLGIRIRTLSDFPDAPEVVEDGLTCEINAVKKANAIMQYTGLPTVADDTGLEVEALGGRPGVHAARYAGPGASYEDNWRKLLHELEGVPREGRRARFITVAAMVSPGAKVEVVKGELEGVIAEEPMGTSGFGYDPVFFVPELSQTLAQLTPAEKNRVSHRARALAKVRQILTTGSERVSGRSAAW